jgi:hypothetical protein
MPSDARRLPKTTHAGASQTGGLVSDTAESSYENFVAPACVHSANRGKLPRTRLVQFDDGDDCKFHFVHSRAIRRPVDLGLKAKRK